MIEGQKITTSKYNSNSKVKSNHAQLVDYDVLQYRTTGIVEPVS